MRKSSNGSGSSGREVERTSIGTGSWEGDLSVESVLNEARVASVADRADEGGGMTPMASVSLCWTSSESAYAIH